MYAETTNVDPAVDGGGDEELREKRAIEAYFSCPANQLWGYRSYIEDESPFFTQQGVKGTEFARVLTVVDDDESSHFQFSYNKYFGITRLSETDRKNQAEGKETVVDRTRRLFYVCCSRAVQDLAVAVFAQDVFLAEKKILEMGLFPPDQIHVFSGPLEDVRAL
jgi:DNA helicase-2/ATP-dependent DNA helicase PcrA